MPARLSVPNEFSRERFTDWLTGSLLHPVPLTIAVAFKKDDFAVVGNNKVKTTEVDTKCLHVSMNSIGQLWEFHSCVLQVRRIKTIIVGGDIAGARLDTA